MLEPFWLEDELPLMMISDSEFSACFPVYDIKTRNTPMSGPEIWGFEIVFIGDRARVLRQETNNNEEIAQKALRIMEKLRSSVAGCLEIEYVADWEASNIKSGALHYYPPSPNIPLYYDALRLPHQNRYLAGDYTEVFFAGIDGAVSSGLRVASQIQESLKSSNLLI